MADISADDVKKLAALAAVHVEEDEFDALKNDITQILGYVEQLNDVDVSGLEPTYQVTGLANVTRPDEIIDYKVSREDLLRNAPDSDSGQIKVNRVLG